MHISKRVKVVAGVSALLGVVVAGGAAFTASYLTAAGQADAVQYIGGTISQTIVGQVIDDINYGYTDDTDADIDAVQLVFSEPDVGATVDVTLTYTGESDGPAVLDCDEVGTLTASITPDNPDNPGADSTGVLASSGTVSTTQDNASFNPAYNSTVPNDVAYCTAGSNATDTGGTPPADLVSVADVTSASVTIGDTH
jgi:hypothetical protein